MLNLDIKSQRMKNIKILLLIYALTLVVMETNAQKRKKKSKEIVVQLYEGPALPTDQVVRIISLTIDKSYAYFIKVDGKDVLKNNRSLTNGAQEISLLPGDHIIQMRFSSGKDGSVFPVEPFEMVTFIAGKCYEVKFEYTAGAGNYITAAMNSRLLIWIEESGSKVESKIVNGMGKEVN